MRQTVGLLTFFLAPAVLVAQPQSRLLTHPRIPPQELLDRLNLELGWKLKIPVEGARDGILRTINRGNRIIVQMRSGELHSVDPETGILQWTAHVGNYYPGLLPIGFSDDLMFVVDAGRMVAIELESGRQRWEILLPAPVSADPISGSFFLHVPLTDGTIVTYILPRVAEEFPRFAERKSLSNASTAEEKIALARLEELRRRIAPAQSARSVSDTEAARFVLDQAKHLSRADRQKLVEVPQVFKEFRGGVTAAYTPIVGKDHIWIGGSGLEYLIVRRVKHDIVARLSYESPLAVRPGQYGDTIYVATQDSVVTAFDLTGVRAVWRYVAGSAVLETPVATESDLFLTTSENGVVRVDRRTGFAAWENRDATRFIAVNPKFVYTMDRFGKMLILDRLTGTELSRSTVGGYVVIPPNDRTDRLILAAHDGTMISLHDQAYKTPVNHTAPTAPPAPKPAEQPAASPPAGPTP